MSEPDLTRHTGDYGAEVAAYALGALQPAEAEAVRRHLETCVVCTEELASLQQVVDVLPEGAPRHRASKALRRRVLAEVGGDGTRPERTRWRGSRQLRPAFATRRPALALGALLAAVVIAIAGVELGSSGSGRTEVFSAQVVGSSGSAEIRVTDGHGELVVHHFAPPPAGQIYEVWLARSNRKPQPTSALFSVTPTGDAAVAVPGDLHGVQQVMVTPEPAGGTKVPTHPAVITAELT
jgi:anti-sigma factor RsiW